MRNYCAVSALIVIHAVLLMRFVDVRALWSAEPLHGEDYELHAGQAFRVLEGLSGWGKSWVYDTSLLAGQPEGTIMDSGNKAWELWVFALTRCGVSRGLAFNTFVLCAMWLCPFVVFAAARVLRLSSLSSVVAALFACMVWFFDSFFHWVWWVGMVSHATATYLSLLPIALFYRSAELEGSRRCALLAGVGVLLGVVLCVHPYAFFALAPAMAAVYAQSFRRFSRAAHAAVAFMMLIAVSLNAYWLLNAFQHRHYLLNSAYYAQGGASYLVSDFCDLLRDSNDTGVIGTRTGFRWLILCLGAGGLVVWRSSRDRRFRPFLLAVAVPLALAYFGVYLPMGGQIQPYRLILPGSLFAVIPAAAFVSAVWQRRDELLGRTVPLLLSIALALGVAQHLTNDILYFVPQSIPEPRPNHDGSRSAMNQFGFLALGANWGSGVLEYTLPHARVFRVRDEAIVSWVKQNAPAGARVLIENGPLGERIAHETEVEVMGGFLERNLAHAEANFFRRYAEHLASHEELARYLELFDIAFVIPEHARADLEQAPDLLAPLNTPFGSSAYRTRLRSSRILGGRGRVSARTNLIRVRASDPGRPIVLSYHWHEALRCQPNCRIERHAIEFDRVGLIRIPAPHPSDLSIMNGYEN